MTKLIETHEYINSGVPYKSYCIICAAKVCSKFYYPSPDFTYKRAIPSPPVALILSSPVDHFSSLV